MVATLIRTVFGQEDEASVRQQLVVVEEMTAVKFPDVATMLADATEELLVSASFLRGQWTKSFWSTNSVERLNAEIKRRTRVVRIFPRNAAVLRLITAVCIDQHDESTASERRYLSAESMTKLNNCDKRYSVVGVDLVGV